MIVISQTDHLRAEHFFVDVVEKFSTFAKWDLYMNSNIQIHIKTNTISFILFEIFKKWQF